MSRAYFEPRPSPYSYYLCPASDIATVSTTFNVFSNFGRESNLSPPRRRQDTIRVTHKRGLTQLTILNIEMDAYCLGNHHKNYDFNHLEIVE